MHEELMEQLVGLSNSAEALEAVKRNRGAAGIDGMPVGRLSDHVAEHWENLRAKLLAGEYVPSPVRRGEIPKPNGGTRLLGRPPVPDRWGQQMRFQRRQPRFHPPF